MLSPVPNWVVAKKVFAGGIRLPKRPKWHDAEQRSHRATFDKGWPLFPARSTSGMNGVLERKGDLLSNGDLRYWNGLNYKDTHSVCRNCREVHHFAKERKAHLKDAGCGSFLTRAIKLLRRSDRCVICDEETKKNCWGLPLCSKECQNEWAWTTTCPAALRAALDLVEREEAK